MENNKPIDVTLIWRISNMTWAIDHDGMEIYSGIWPAIAKEHDITDILAKRYNVKITRIRIG